MGCLVHSGLGWSVFTVGALCFHTDDGGKGSGNVCDNVGHISRRWRGTPVDVAQSRPRERTLVADLDRECSLYVYVR